MSWTREGNFISYDGYGTVTILEMIPDTALTLDEADERYCEEVTLDIGNKAASKLEKLIEDEKVTPGTRIVLFFPNRDSWKASKVWTKYADQDLELRVRNIERILKQGGIYVEPDRSRLLRQPERPPTPEQPSAFRGYREAAARVQRAVAPAPEPTPPKPVRTDLPDLPYSGPVPDVQVARE